MKAQILFTAFLTCILCGYSQDQIQTPEEEIIGTTWYDVQTTRSMQSRIYYFPDGTIGATWNMSFDLYGWEEMEIGYNYFDGDNWGPYPTQSIANVSARNPSYTKFGEDGEIVVSEGENGLIINYRMTKGEGDWEEMIFQGPAGFEKLYSPQIVTTGNSDEVIHLLALKKMDSIQFEDYYQDNTGQVLYSRSLDYVTTWDILHHEFDFNQNYFGFSELSLGWAEPKNNTLAFMAGDYYTDLILMKSTDGGDSWQKTIIWEHPYPYFEHNVMLVDTFWANSGSQSLTMDLYNSKVHLTFAVTAIISDTLNWTGHNDWWADGIVYWNEDRPTFSNNLNALCAFVTCPYSELVEDYSLIGWTQDINNNGVLDILPYSWQYGGYPSLGLSTLPTIIMFYPNQIIIAWSSVTETFDNGTASYRHLWTRSSTMEGDLWGSFYDLTSDLIHIFDECAFPVFASNPEDEYMHLIYQRDNEPGLHIENGGPPPSENFITHMKVWYEYPFYLFVLFNADQTLIHEGETVNFNNYSYGSPGPINYLWYFEGGTPETSTEINPSVTYFIEGLYDVTLIGSNDLFVDTVIMEDYITVLPETEINEIEGSEQIIIYPNPTTGKFVINLPYLFESKIKVFDLKGEIIFQQSISLNNEAIEIDLSGHAKGVYYLNIISDTLSITKKVLVK